MKYLLLTHLDLLNLAKDCAEIKPPFKKLYSLIGKIRHGIMVLSVMNLEQKRATLDLGSVA